MRAAPSTFSSTPSASPAPPKRSLAHVESLGTVVKRLDETLHRLRSAADYHLTCDAPAAVSAAGAAPQPSGMQDKLDCYLADIHTLLGLVEKEVARIESL